MVPGLQAKMLRFLEEKSFKRVGGSADIRVDVRVVAATNRKLETEVKEGRFREDLYYRLNVLPIELPPLRARAGDLPLLVNYYVDTYNSEFRKHVRGVDARAMDALKAYGWPGNVRELRNVVERAVLLSSGGVITPAHLPVEKMGPVLAPAASAPKPAPARALEPPADPLSVTLTGTGAAAAIEPFEFPEGASEKDRIVLALDRCGGNQSHAAKLLGISRRTLINRIEDYGLPRPRKRG